jgi:hypothetical protein
MAQPNHNRRLRSAYQILSVIIVIIDFSIMINYEAHHPNVTTGLGLISYMGAVLSTPLRASICVICIYAVC